MHLFYPPPKEKPSKSVYLNHSGLVGVCSHPSWEPEKTQSNALGVQDHLSLMTGHSLLISYLLCASKAHQNTFKQRRDENTSLFFCTASAAAFSFTSAVPNLCCAADRFMSDSILSPVIILERSDFENSNKRRTGWGCYTCAVGFCFKLAKALVTVANVDTQRQTKKRVKRLGE